jgi:hypothetical protein
MSQIVKQEECHEARRMAYMRCRNSHWELEPVLRETTTEQDVKGKEERKERKMECLKELEFGIC